MDAKKSIEVLQFLITDLTNKAFSGRSLLQLAFLLCAFCSPAVAGNAKCGKVYAQRHARIENTQQGSNQSSKQEPRTMATVYDFKLQDKEGNDVSLSEYKGKVLLIVNTATGCGFTPQYEELEAMYRRLKDKGLEILDIPCDQFGHQTPGTDEQITQFCTAKFGTDFPQFKKSEVNGTNELPLYTWLKSRKGYAGGAYSEKMLPVMEKLYNEYNKEPRKPNDIQWNFSKFVINRKGEVVARFEPTENLKNVEACIVTCLEEK